MVSVSVAFGMALDSVLGYGSMLCAMDPSLASSSSSPRHSTGAQGPLLAGALAALLASGCCLGPLVLLGLGVTGAWVGNLTALEPWRPFFVAVALGALLLAARRIWRPVAVCVPGEVCAVPRVRRGYQWTFLAIALLVGVAVTFPWVAPWFY
jgi:mercuric ion transport protein